MKQAWTRPEDFGNLRFGSLLLDKALKIDPPMIGRRNSSRWRHALLLVLRACTCQGVPHLYGREDEDPAHGKEFRGAPARGAFFRAEDILSDIEDAREP